MSDETGAREGGFGGRDARRPVAARPWGAVATALRLPGGLVAGGAVGAGAAVLGMQKAEATMDPRLQWLLECGRSGFVPRPTSSTLDGEVAVIARVKDLAAWEARTDVGLSETIASTQSAGHIVTGRVPVLRLEELRADPNLLSLKAPQRVGPALKATLEDLGATRALLPAGARGHLGKGVVVGIVDFGCDFTHRDFLDAKGRTRLLGIWDQWGTSRQEGPVKYGRFHPRADIDRALRARRPFEALGYRPDQDEGWEDGAHGTHVMGIAGGRNGVAPGADLLFVELAGSDVPWTGPDVVGTSFGDSVHLLEAVKFIFDQAGERPCVVNLSLGTNGGPHDGTSLVELGLDQLVADRPNRAVVLAASNSYADGIHAEGLLSAGATVELEWQVRGSDRTSNELELWYGGQDAFAAELVAPGGQSLGVLELGQSGSLQDDNGTLAIQLSHRKGDPNNGDNTLGIYLEAGLPGGVWRVRLHARSVSPGGGRFHAWIERDDAGPSMLIGPLATSDYTLGSISCGRHSLVVGSYDAHKQPGVPLSYFSSAGPTRDERPKPEVSAPGHEVWSSLSGSGSEQVRMSGTSMAAPAVSGLVALAYAEAQARGLDLDIASLRALVSDTSRPMGDTWHRRYGAGRVHAATAVQALMDGTYGSAQPARPRVAGGEGRRGGGRKPGPGKGRGSKGRKRTAA